jgi:hypothetical protein
LYTTPAEYLSTNIGERRRKVTMTMTVLIFIVVARLTGYGLLIRIDTNERSNRVPANAGAQSIGIIFVCAVIAFVNV